MMSIRAFLKKYEDIVYTGIPRLIVEVALTDFSRDLYQKRYWSKL
jgi:hypothetical protein